MRRRTLVIAATAAGVLLAAGAATAVLAADGHRGAEGPAADAAYDYPELTDADRADPTAAIERLQIPADRLEAMTSEALVRSVLEFPYMGNAFASNELNGEVAFLAEQCNALAALLERPDAADAVAAVRTTFVDGGEVETAEYGAMKLELLDLIAAAVAPE